MFNKLVFILTIILSEDLNQRIILVTHGNGLHVINIKMFVGLLMMTFLVERIYITTDYSL